MTQYYIPYTIFSTSYYHPSTITSISSSVVNPISTTYYNYPSNPNLLHSRSVFPAMSYVDQFGNPLLTYSSVADLSYQLSSPPLQIFPAQQASTDQTVVPVRQPSILINPLESGDENIFAPSRPESQEVEGLEDLLNKLEVELINFIPNPLPKTDLDLNSSKTESELLPDLALLEKSIDELLNNIETIAPVQQQEPEQEQEQQQSAILVNPPASRELQNIEAQYSASDPELWSPPTAAAGIGERGSEGGGGEEVILPPPPTRAAAGEAPAQVADPAGGVGGPAPANLSALSAAGAVGEEVGPAAAAAAAAGGVGGPAPADGGVGGGPDADAHAEPRADDRDPAAAAEARASDGEPAAHAEPVAASAPADGGAGGGPDHDPAAGGGQGEEEEEVGPDQAAQAEKKVFAIDRLTLRRNKIIEVSDRSQPQPKTFDISSEGKFTKSMKSQFFKDMIGQDLLAIKDFVKYATNGDRNTDHGASSVSLNSDDEHLKAYQLMGQEFIKLTEDQKTKVNEIFKKIIDDNFPKSKSTSLSTFCSFRTKNKSHKISEGDGDVDKLLERLKTNYLDGKTTIDTREKAQNLYKDIYLITKLSVVLGYVKTDKQEIDFKNPTNIEILLAMYGKKETEIPDEIKNNKSLVEALKLDINRIEEEKSKYATNKSGTEKLFDFSTRVTTNKNDQDIKKREDFLVKLEQEPQPSSAPALGAAAGAGAATPAQTPAPAPAQTPVP